MSDSCEEKRAAFRALHQRDTPLLIPNPWDVGSARILHGMGFEALATTSAGMAFSMGICEGKSSRDAVLDHCRTLVDATPLPVSADLEKGFADTPEGVAETVRLAGDTGLAGCSIEDHTGDRANPIFDEGLAVERVAAAVVAARAVSPNFILTARCESLLWGGRDLDMVIRRLQAFEVAGADVLYAPGLKDLDSIRTVCQSVSKPVNVVMGMPGATFDLSALKAAGVKRVSIGSAFARLAYGSLLHAAQEIQDHGSFGFSARAASFDAIERYFRPTS
ncbi:MAG: isocitrate lyase/phosphoenolpyruvate mutase family protein [Alphaproteobacteria bacterium]|nr:isocitrate lyase/phosphoenolpyruvate mutase family protein [Alphaproteobacteria bacterium]